MSIEFVEGDMFETPGIHVIAHGVNARGAFGAGVAGEIARRFPWAAQDYHVWCASSPRAGSLAFGLGAVRMSHPPRTIQAPSIAHLCTQINPGRDAKLHAVEACIKVLRPLIKPGYVVAFPPIGCGIGGLEWSEVRPLMKGLLETTNFTALVFEVYQRGQPAKRI